MFPMFAPTAEFAAPGFPDAALPGIYRKLTHILFNNIFRHGGGMLYGFVRRSHPEFPPLTGWPFSPKSGRITPLLFGFSEHVVPRPADWPAWAHITGYWQMDEPREQDIPADVRRFLELGPGAGVHRFRKRRAEGYAAAGRHRPGCSAPDRAAGNPLDWREGDGRRRSMRGIFFRSDRFPTAGCSQGWVAVVHHGGAGTTGAGLRAGVPNIVVPFTADQPFWAARVRALGAGPEPIPLRNLTAETLAAAIDAALHDGAMRARCAALGKKIDAENGVDRAVKWMRTPQ